MSWWWLEVKQGIVQGLNNVKTKVDKRAATVMIKM